MQRSSDHDDQYEEEVFPSLKETIRRNLMKRREESARSGGKATGPSPSSSRQRNAAGDSDHADHDRLTLNGQVTGFPENDEGLRV